MRLVAGLLTALAAGALAAPPAVAGEGDIQTIAGNGNNGVGLDGILGTSATIDEPRDAVVKTGGGYLYVDTKNYRIRTVALDGIATTLAGTGIGGFLGDLGIPLLAQFDEPSGIAATPDGGFLVADTNNDRVRKILGSQVTTVAGSSTYGFTGDGGPATSAKLHAPWDVAALPGGGFLIADHDNHAVRKVDATGTITTVAGTGSSGFSGDGGLATAAKLDQPHAVSPTSDGGFLVADTNNNRIRRVSPAGVITTVAGMSSSGFSGDGGDATSAKLSKPSGVAVAPDGGFMISDTDNHRLRRVTADGKISTVAGNGNSGFTGDGAGVSVRLNGPAGLEAAVGGVVFADTLNRRIRILRLDLRAPVLPDPPAGDPPITTIPRELAGGGVANGGGGGEPETTDRSERSQPSAPASPLAPAAPPKTGRRMTVESEGGVRVRLPGGTGFVPLDGAASIPVGSVIDATVGSVELTSAAGGSTRTATFAGTRFRVGQQRVAGALTEVVLDAPLSCPRRGTATTSAKKAKRASSLWGSGHGRFRTRGRQAAATVRGTVWLTQDRCDGTYVRVARGRVDVTDLARRTTRSLKAGTSRLVKR